MLSIRSKAMTREGHFDHKSLLIYEFTFVTEGDPDCYGAIVQKYSKQCMECTV